MGKNGLNAILNLAGVSHYVDSYPPDNLEKGFDFSELSAIGTALEEMYGPRGGGSGLACRASYFLRCVEELRGPCRCCRSGFCCTATSSKLRIGLDAFAKMFVQLTDQETSVEEKDAEFVWTIVKCPCCWGRRNEDKPVCYISTGLLLEFAQVGLGRK